MKMKVIVHEAEEGGYWAEVPALPGCVSEAATWEEMLANIREAIAGCLAANVKQVELIRTDRVVEIDV
jgi:predicted RNase H-like HicB family nuclease